MLHEELDELAANGPDDGEMRFASLLDEMTYVIKNEVAACKDRNFIVCRGCTAENLEGVTYHEKEQSDNKVEAWCLDAGRFKKEVRNRLLK